jgi:hypothetical protein
MAMKINYELEEFSDETCTEISKQLRTELIPHILEKKTLLIDKINEDAVDEILSKVGSVHSLQAKPDPVRAPAFTTREIAATTSGRSEDEPGGIALAGALIGGGFGVLVVISALTDPNYEGRVYLFLPAIIFAVVGFYVSSGIEKIIRQTRKKW